MANNRTYFYFLREKALPCPSGERLKDRNILVRDGNNLSLKKVGEIDTQEQIQTHLDGVSLARMITRFERGDDAALTVRSGFFGDVSGMETDPALMINQTRAAVRSFAVNQRADQSADQSAAQNADQSAAQNADQSAAQNADQSSAINQGGNE